MAGACGAAVGMAAFQAPELDCRHAQALHSSLPSAASIPNASRTAHFLPLCAPFPLSCDKSTRRGKGSDLHTKSPSGVEIVQGDVRVALRVKST